ncbi:MAG: ribonuclease P protein component [Clostridia bacterium]|nr:ribonuclease P protein component [Clostridia bacterium]
MQAESLRKNYEFARIYRRGKCKFGKYLSLYSIEGSANKIGITVSKKAYKSSVKRNRLKRLVKECYRTFEKDIKTAEIVFVIRKTEEFPEYNDICREMKYLLNNSNLFIGETHD